VDAHFRTLDMTMSQSLLLIAAANTLIMGKRHSTAHELYKMQHPRLLMLCWRSVDSLSTLIFSCSDIDIDYIARKCGQYFDSE